MMKPVLHYYPTYQSLTDPELRGYFSWRTKLRRGDVQKTSLSYAFLYIYELLNQIGVTDPVDGYQKLKNFQSVYGGLDGGILPHLNRWLVDYVIYYGLDRPCWQTPPRFPLTRLWRCLSISVAMTAVRLWRQSTSWSPL